MRGQVTIYRSLTENVSVYNSQLGKRNQRPHPLDICASLRRKEGKTLTS